MGLSVNRGYLILGPQFSETPTSYSALDGLGLSIVFDIGSSEGSLKFVSITVQ